MNNKELYELNRKAWNNMTAKHVDSEFYNVAKFRETKNDLPKIDQDVLGDLKGKKVLHLQCHFGMNTLSLVHLGAEATGVDISDASIQKANDLSREMNLPARFIRSSIADLPEILDETFDIVYTSWGAIGWLPDMNEWAKLVAKYLRPGGKLVMAEFHPFIYTLNDSQEIHYNYFNQGPDIETDENTYTGDKIETTTSAYWNHDFGELLTGITQAGMQIETFQEFDYQPYNCFKNMTEEKPQEFIFEKYGRKVPYCFALTAIKSK